MRKAGTYFLLACLLCSFQLCVGHITVDSMHVTPSTCPNNGTATIYATSTNDSAVFLYNIVTGPVTYPQQNDSTFSSLYPGTYVAWVHDINSFDSTEVTFSITGNYIAPVITATGVSPLCGYSPTGQITGQLTPGTGIPPYEWQMFSPDSLAPQISDTFNGLAPGTYIVRVIDGCSVASSYSVIINPGQIGLPGDGTQINFIGCDTAILYNYFYLEEPGFNNYPLLVTTTTDMGTTEEYLPPHEYYYNHAYNLYYTEDTIYNISYGDYLYSCVKDTCQDVLCYTQDTVSPFNFIFTFTQASSGCQTGYIAYGLLSDAGNNILTLTNPYGVYTVVTRNNNTGALIDSIVEGRSYLGLYVPQQPNAFPILITVTDNCGDFYQHVIQWPSPPAPSCYITTNNQASCLDATGTLDFNYSGFGSGVTLTIISGPSAAQSSQPHFSYYDTIIYPLSFITQSTSYYALNNMPTGSYTYQLTDSCGNIYNGSCSVTNVNYLQAAYFYQSNCNGTGYFGIIDGGVEEIEPTIWPIEFTPTEGGYSVSDPVGPGTYLLQFGGGGGGCTSCLTGNFPCPYWSDTIVIPTLSEHTLEATDVATCSGTIYIFAIVDGTAGTLPYQYEIISGPETFPPQDSNVFVVNQFGTYLVGVIDSCGNVDTRYISTDSGRFDPVIRGGGWCLGATAQLYDVSSPYFTYQWVKPDGSIYMGDTLTITPISYTDTGVYRVTKIVTINGCQDSAVGTYRFLLSDTTFLSVSICPGTVYYAGGYTYPPPGTYYNQYSGSGECDSIVEITISYLSAPNILITSDQPLNCPTDVATLTATGADEYIWNNDYESNTYWTFGEAGVYTVVGTDTTDGCTASASVTLAPILRSSEVDLYKCPGDTIIYNNQVYDSTVHFNDTLTSVRGCDSIIRVYITIWPVMKNTIVNTQNSVCQTGPYTLFVFIDTNTTDTWFPTYQWSTGNVTDSVTVNPVTSTVYTVTVNNQINCPVVDTISVTPPGDSTISFLPGVVEICAGDSQLLCAPSGYTTYYWSNNSSAECVTVTTPGILSVTATDAQGCTVISNNAVLKYDTVIPPVIIFNNGSLTCSSYYSSYQWYLNGELISGGTGHSLLNLSGGSYILQVTDSNGCSAFSNALILTGINNVLNNEGSITVYPNPTTDGTWQVEVSETLVGSLCEVFDAQGKTVYSGYLTGTKCTVSTKIAAGMYVMKISSARGTFDVKLVQF